jgi:hypothetical protein
LSETFLDVNEIIDPSVLEDDSALVPFQPTTYVDPAIFFANSDQWRDDHQDDSPIQSSLSSTPSSSSSPTSSQLVEEVYFDCGCSNLHIRVNRLNLYLPVTPNFFANTLRIDVWCSLAGLLENCRVLGIPKASFCGDDSESPFFRLASSERESAQLVASVRAMTGAVKHDLRPTPTQIVRSHHPYIDVLPFRDMRENLIRIAHQIDEDDFLLDFFNNVICWGGVPGSKTGRPWDGRSWEASPFFLQKWAAVVGGQDGELTRQSLWWRSMRGEETDDA